MNNSLVYIDLSSNRIDDEGLKQFAVGLRNNKTLREVISLYNIFDPKNVELVMIRRILHENIKRKIPALTRRYDKMERDI